MRLKMILSIRLMIWVKGIFLNLCSIGGSSLTVWIGASDKALLGLTMKTIGDIMMMVQEIEMVQKSKVTNIP